MNQKFLENLAKRPASRGVGPPPDWDKPEPNGWATAT